MHILMTRIEISMGFIKALIISLLIRTFFRAIDGKEFEIAFNLCFQCCDPPLGNHLFLVEQCTWSHPVMAHYFPQCSVQFSDL